MEEDSVIPSTAPPAAPLDAQQQSEDPYFGMYNTIHTHHHTRTKTYTTHTVSHDQFISTNIQTYIPTSIRSIDFDLFQCRCYSYKVNCKVK